MIVSVSAYFLHFASRFFSPPSTMAHSGLLSFAYCNMADINQIWTKKKGKRSTEFIDARLRNCFESLL